MPASESKIRTNRQNAQKSTGPKTKQGKAIASRNALKHGLFTANIVIRSQHHCEDPEEYNRLLASITDELKPETALQEHLVRRIANCLWRSNRAVIAETAEIKHALSNVDNELKSRARLRAILAGEQFDGDTAALSVNDPEHRDNLIGQRLIPSEETSFNILRYEMRLDRQMTRAYLMLVRLQQQSCKPTEDETDPTPADSTPVPTATPATIEKTAESELPQNSDLPISPCTADLAVCWQSSARSGLPTTRTRKRVSVHGLPPVTTGKGPGNTPAQVCAGKQKMTKRTQTFVVPQQHGPLIPQKRTQIFGPKAVSKSAKSAIGS